MKTHKFKTLWSVEWKDDKGKLHLEHCEDSNEDGIVMYQTKKEALRAAKYLKEYWQLDVAGVARVIVENEK